MRSKAHFGLLLVGLALFASGCTATRPAGQMDRINQLAQKKTATVVLRSGLLLTAEGLRVSVDSTYWIDPKSKTLQSVPTALVTDVRFRSAGVGSSRGALLGGLAGAAFGVVVGYGLNSLGCTEEDVERGGGQGLFNCRRAIKKSGGRTATLYAIPTFLGFAAGALPGALVGAVVGGREEYPVELSPNPGDVQKNK
ncbi:MAG: hypothetical protein ACI9BV_003769 [Rhodothermales bacterium]|jgi:hypothetical protein